MRDMNEPSNGERASHEERWGLCASCRHVIVITSDRGSTFVQCGLAKTDPRFKKYPPLPVIACAGHDKIK
jgi:hypothetical protein